MDTISGYIYQLTHRYIGPMDKIVLYVKDNYSNTKNLTIDTEIEQPVLMYYLNAKVLCDDIEKCFTEPPDLIIPRRALLSDPFVARANKSFSEAKYERVLLPILDYPSNNIPEFSLALRHLFKSPFTDNDVEKINLFVRK